jgi:uncharacterized protein with FMN-binding domain
MPAKRMHRGLVALSASAIAAVYMVGYVRTQSADAALAVSSQPSAVSTQPPAVSTRPPAVSVASGQSQPSATASSPVVVTPRGTYKDGTYTGQGSSRRGDVAVSVAVQGGRIASVSITRSTLQYPLNVIAGLPGEVVQRQSAQVDVVSRATYSSQAFRGAVTQALSHATT